MLVVRGRHHLDRVGWTPSIDKEDVVLMHIVPLGELYYWFVSKYYPGVRVAKAIYHNRLKRLCIFISNAKQGNGSATEDLLR